MSVFLIIFYFRCFMISDKSNQELKSEYIKKLNRCY